MCFHHLVSESLALMSLPQDMAPNKRDNLLQMYSFFSKYR